VVEFVDDTPNDGRHYHALENVTGDGLTSEFINDANGNKTSRKINTVTYTQTFDVENRLTGITFGGQTTSFYYDADGNRILTVLPNGTKVYTPFPEYEKTVPTSGASTERSSYYLAGQLIGVWVRVGAGAGTLYYAFADRLGSVAGYYKVDDQFLSNSLARYDPYGVYRTEPPASVNPDISDRGYTGHRMNNTGTNDLGLIYMNARYYLPEIGRFISADSIVPDPSNPQSYNRYTYVLNDPINSSDPTGHMETSGCDGYVEGCTWDSTPLGDGPDAEVYPYDQTVAVSYYYDPPSAPMHLYTSPNFGRRPANFVDQTYGGASTYVNYETDYLWMKFDVLRQHANESEIRAMAAREAHAMCNSGSGRCTIGKVSLFLSAYAGPFALARPEAAGSMGLMSALIKGSDAVVHNDGGNIGQIVITEIAGATADGALPGVGGFIIDGTDLDKATNFL